MIIRINGNSNTVGMPRVMIMTKKSHDSVRSADMYYKSCFLHDKSCLLRALHRAAGPALHRTASAPTGGQGRSLERRPGKHRQERAMTWKGRNDKEPKVTIGRKDSHTGDDTRALGQECLR